MKAIRGRNLAFLCLLTFLAGGCSRGIPNDAKLAALRGRWFTGPIEVTLYHNSVYGWQLTQGPGQDERMFVEKVLIPEDLCQKLPPSPRAAWFVPTGKAKAAWREVKNWPSSYFLIPIAKRSYLATTYENRWTEGGTEMGSLTFTYEIHPILVSLPKLGPFEGKIVAALDPSDGKWKLQQSRLGDQGVNSYAQWLHQYQPNVAEVQRAVAKKALAGLSDAERAKRTAADIRAIATAVESYDVDHNCYPAGASLAGVRDLLTPTYIRSVPMRDCWDRPIQFSCDGSRYELRSLGSDGNHDADTPQGAAAGFAVDIVFADGEFVQLPEGIGP